METSKLLVKEGDDAKDFVEILKANFNGDVTHYVVAAMKVFSDVITGDFEIVDGENLVSIIGECRERTVPKRSVREFSFFYIDVIKDLAEKASEHQDFDNDQSIFYSASCTYQVLLDKYLDGVRFINTKRTSDRLCFGGTLELVHPFELCDEKAFYLCAEAWLEIGNNNAKALSPAQIEPMLKKLYKDARESLYPRDEILKMYKYQEEFKDYRHLRIV